MLSAKITCSACRTTFCPAGQYVTTNEEGTRRAYVCTKCLAGAQSPVVQNALKIKTLDAPKVLSLRVGGGCSPDCKTAATRGCSVAQRAAQLSELEAEFA